MNQPPFKPILLDLVHHARSAQDAFVQSLDPAERAAAGSAELWAAKDHVAHMTFWRQRLNLHLRAALQRETPPENIDYEQVNPIVFERLRLRPWPEILAESDQAYADLVALTERFADDDLTAPHRFEWIAGGQPVYTAYMGSCCEHTEQHLAQYYLERQQLAFALRSYEDWVESVVQTAAPDALKGDVLYNLACFCATHGAVEQAAPTLERAYALHPELIEFARTDPDLDILRSNPG